MRQCTQLLVILLMLVLLTASVGGATADRYRNSSEPAFLQDIGPQDERSDSPAAALITAAVVGLVFYRGFKVYGDT